MLYDVIIVLGSKPDMKSWEFPSHVTASLDKAAKLYESGATDTIAVSGNHALWFDKRGISQPQTEADMMSAYLKGINVPERAIVREDKSRDTIANLYFLKRTVLVPRAAKRVLFIVGDFRLPRLQYLARKIFGKGYDITFQTVASTPDEQYPNETATLEKTKYYLAAMKPGDDSFLDGMFYGHPLYTAPWPLA